MGLESGIKFQIFKQTPRQSPSSCKIAQFIRAMHFHQPWVAHCCWIYILVSNYFFWSPFGSHSDTFAEMLQLPFHANETVVPASFLPFLPGRNLGTMENLSTIPFAFFFWILLASCTCSFNLLIPTHYLPTSPTTAAASVFPFLSLISSLVLSFLQPYKQFSILFLV